MLKEVIKSQIENLIITDTIEDENNVIIIDQNIMDKSDIMEGEKITVRNISNGYSIDMIAENAPRHSNIVCTSNLSNLLNIGDRLTLLTYKYIDSKLIEYHKMTNIHIDTDNKIKTNKKR